MNEIWTWLVHQALNNQFFAGGVVMGLIGWGAMVMRTWPLHIGKFLGRQFMTEIEIRSTDGEAFMHTALWLSKHRDRKDARRLGMIDYWDDEEGDGNYEVTFGFGNHVIWDRMVPILINRSVQEGSVPSSQPVQTITIRTIGRGHKRILDMLEGAKKSVNDSPKVGIYIWTSGHYRLVDRREPRPMDSVIMPKKEKDDLVHDLESFLQSKAWYRDRGLPWRRGYLLEGPPGTGKSSTIFALAGVAKKSVHIINPATVMNDNEMMEAFASANDGIIILEDIDAVRITNTREPNADPEKEKEKGLTLSGLLNAIDGVAARDGRVLFITSNHPDKLDPALIRAGRVDRRVHLGLLTRELGAEMWARFFPGEDGSAFLDTIQFPIAPATLQGALLKWEGAKVVRLDRTPQIIDTNGVGGVEKSAS